MTLISVLIGIAIDRFASGLPELRRYERFYDYVHWIRQRIEPVGLEGWAAVIAVLAPWLLLVWVLQASLEDGVLALVGLLFSVAVLVFCLGPRDLPADVDEYCGVADAEDGPRWHAAEHFAEHQEVPLEPEVCHDMVVHGVLVGAMDRWFGVLFWFVLLGPLGAVFYRGVVLLRAQAEDDRFGAAVDQLYGLLGWIPARLIVAGYALSGHFEHAVRAWREAEQGTEPLAERNAAVLYRAGEGALSLQIGEELASSPMTLIRSAMALVWRTLSMWLVVIALLTLAGWAS